MRRLVFLSGAAALFGLAVSSAAAIDARTTATTSASRPPHISTTGQAHRAPIANTKGANQRHFCPPGQARKPGKGSAFNC